ncbi:MAG: SDR family oxidoreductase [Bacteroidales bacterium]
MKILLTGATGYIAKKLLPVLLADGHEVICCVRDKQRFDTSRYSSPGLSVIEADFLDESSLVAIPENIDTAYYLIHSMSTSIDDFESLEKTSAVNFRDRMNQTSVKQVVYLSGIVNNKTLSKHLKSRKAVEEILGTGTYHLTTLRAGIIVGAGSASFEIIRDLVEKLPVMVAPRWLETKSQPIAIRNVIEYLKSVPGNEPTYDQSFDIGGPDILSYKQMLLQFAEVRNLKRRIFVVLVMTPKLSSYWLYFITSTSYKLAVNLVHSMKIEIICGENNLQKVVPVELLHYKEAVRSAFDKIEQQEVLSSWTDALNLPGLQKGISELINIPTFGCFHDKRSYGIKKEERGVLDRIWALGGDTGWYYANWLWKVRGFMDKLAGGVGLRRGRRNEATLFPGDSLDFWRVILADRDGKRLLLFAEMKLPGEAWLEFKIENKKLIQTATFRPLGLWGRLYWYAVSPLHFFVFRGMAKRIAGG